MRFGPHEFALPRAVLLALLVFTVIALGVAAGTSTASFGTYNPTWDGTAELRRIASDADAEPRIIENTSAYRDVQPRGTVAVILSPDSSYRDTELQQLRRFIRDGGTLVVAEDFGSHGNEILTGIDSSVRFDTRLLRDEREYHRAPDFPVVEPVADHPLVSDVESLTLNHGTVIEPAEATVVVASSPYGYLDGNRNGAPDPDETLRSRPVVTVERMGDGRVIAVGDPSLFINAMLDRGGNRVFVTNLFDDQDRVLLDVSHATALPPLVRLVLFVRNTPLATVAIGLIVVVATGYWVGHPSIFSDRWSPTTTEDSEFSLDENTLLASFERRWPGESDHRIERLFTAFKSPPDDNGDNG